MDPTKIQIHIMKIVSSLHTIIMALFFLTPAVYQRKNYFIINKNKIIRSLDFFGKCSKVKFWVVKWANFDALFILKTEKARLCVHRRMV